MGSKRQGWIGIGVGAVAAFSMATGVARADDIRVLSTSDTVDAGLVEGLLRPAYLAAQPGDTLNYVGEGTGKALADGRAGLGDVVITHAPTTEKKFVDDGFSFEPLGRAIFYSDYVILGPSGDPAGVLAGAPHDAVHAFELIAAAGSAGKATFVSRDEASGTNVQEQLMWGLTDGDVAKQPALNAAGAAGRSEPGTGGTIPAWYKTTGKLQADNLLDAEACTPTDTNPNGGCYTIVDRGTYNNLVNKGVVTRLKVLSENNAATARGGENLLINPFSAYIVNPAKITKDPKPNVAAATRFLDFLTSPAFQTAIESFPSAASPAFRPDAFAKVDATTPATAVAGSPISFPLSLTNRLPGGGVIAGQPIQLQSSTNGTTWADVGAPVASDAAGRATVSATAVSTATTYRVVLPRFAQFSPSTTALGAVAVVPAPVITTPAPTPIDKTAPALTKVKLSTKSISVNLTEASTVKVTIKLATTRKVKGKRKTTYKTVKSLTVKALRAGTATRSFKALKAGTYRLTLVATDAAGNQKSRTVTIKVKAAKKSKA